MKNIEQCHAFLNRQVEPEVLKVYRNFCLQKLETAPEMEFKYGLNIVIRPTEFNFNIIPADSPKLERNITKNKTKMFTSETISKMNKEEKNIFEKFLDKNFLSEYDKMDYVNQALTNDIFYVIIPEECEEKIYVETNIQSNIFTNIFIYAKKNSKSKIFIKKSSDKNVYVSETIRIIAEENARVECITIQDIDKSSINIQKRKSIIKKDAEVRWIDMCLGSRYTKTSVISELQEEGASTNNVVLYLADGEQKMDIYTVSIHQAPHTNSDIITKGVLNNEAKTLSRGLIKIEKNAFGSNGYEKQDSLLLSEFAQSNAIPNLKINNHDVKCSHGSTVGQLDQDKVFYCMSRGLNKMQAQQKIVEGYFIPVLDNIHDKIIKEKMHEIIAQKLHA